MHIIAPAKTYAVTGTYALSETCTQKTLHPKDHVPHLLDQSAAIKAGLTAVATVSESAYYRKIHRKSLCSMQLCTCRCKLIAPAKFYALRGTYALSGTCTSRGNYCSTLTGLSQMALKLNKRETGPSMSLTSDLHR